MIAERQLEFERAKAEWEAERKRVTEQREFERGTYERMMQQRQQDWQQTMSMMSACSACAAQAAAYEAQVKTLLRAHTHMRMHTHTHTAGNAKRKSGARRPNLRALKRHR